MALLLLQFLFPCIDGALQLRNLLSMFVSSSLVIVALELKLGNGVSDLVDLLRLVLAKVTVMRGLGFDGVYFAFCSNLLF